MSNVVPFERAVDRRIARYLDEIGAWHVKTTGVSKVGCPDRIACYKGRFIAIECKQSSNANRRPKQEYELKRIVDAGGYGFFAHTLDALRAVVREIDSQNAAGFPA